MTTSILLWLGAACEARAAKLPWAINRQAADEIVVLRLGMLVMKKKK